ncbi:ABC transporter substrate-binding protein [Bifidobacterium aquikefiri]|uniref:ABC transporter substrate-binding protein n=1 Tax=Bifidobacterium aquikefiri TaxID=1653207 RepID=UPI0039E8E255
MKKKLIAGILTIAALGAALSGCGGTDASGTGADGAVKVTIWGPVDTDAAEAWWEEKIPEFNKAHKGKIELSREAIIRADSYAYEDKVNAAVTSNDLPDILYVDGPNVSNYAANGIIQPIDSIFPEAELTDFVDSVKVQGTYDGELYAMSATESSVGLYYNKDMTEAAGIEVPTKIEDAWTWSEYYDAAKKLTKDGVLGTNVIMDKGEGIPYALEPFWVSNGTDYISEDATTADGYINGEKSVEAVNFLNKLIKEGIAPLEPLQDAFGNGTVATLLGGSWEIANLETNFPDLNWGLTYYPVADNNGKNASPTGDWAATITASSEKYDEAAEVMTWLMNEENVTSYAKVLSKLPTRNSSYETLTEFNEYPRSIMKEQSMVSGSPRPRTPSYTVLSTGISEALLNIFSGADVQTELDALAQEYDEDFQSNYAE